MVVEDIDVVDWESGRPENLSLSKHIIAGILENLCFRFLRWDHGACGTLSF
jgi:hypothetical protein